ncbi:signal peptidase I [Caviibacter abscessus]|uniref:signal peptidase I n=1 Tax=Caviibacter abscessus TaxID=1766719 RepID=UPI000832E456|nr:signal peptidase I [Caviibacter abscessus]
MFLWILFYIITAIAIILFFVNEKFVTNNINKVSDFIYEKVNMEKSINDNIIKGINILSALSILAVYLFFMDKTKSEVIPIKFYALHFIVIVNILGFLFNKYKEYLFLLNFVMFIAAVGLVGIDDIYFKYTMLATLFVIVISLFLEKDKFKESLRKLLNGLFLILLASIIQLHYLGNYIIPTQSMEPTIQVQDRIFSNNILYKFKSPMLNDIISFSEPLDNKVMYTKRITGVAGTVFKIENDRVYSDNKLINDRYYSLGTSSVYSMLNQSIYIPKKGDEVSISKIVSVNISDGTLQLIEPKEFIEIAKGLDYKRLIGLYNSNNYESKYRYTFLLQAKGHNEMMLPIMDFKYDKDLFDKLLNGGSVTLTDDYYMAMGDNTDNSQDSRYFGYVKKSRIKGKLFFRWFPINRAGLVKDEK